LAFADFGGNRQMLTTGNLSVNNRIALFLMDYPRRERLKILGYARVEEPELHPELLAKLAEPASARNVERIFIIDVLAFDWNCAKYITPRFTADQIQNEGLVG
jgi:predicted pyridoxine 5'-phosphate oxidase superfamily flavin-nucleotide-binding protein